jgi:penicillin amidase
MRRFSLIVSSLAAAAALYVGQFAVGPVPPLGNFLDPARGVWSVAKVAELPATDERALSGLGGNVTVKYDDRGVPHIFADAELDAYRALGWVHARDRLFQMELTQRAVAGTLTELLGARALPLDRESRRLGLARAAEAKWAAIAEGSEVRAAVSSYMEGVNAYVAGMGRADLPIEYRLLGRRPRRFEPKDTYYLLARMSQTLSYQESELRTAAVEQLIGKAATDALFPIDAPIQEPIEPVPGRTQARIISRPIPAPELATPPRIAMARKYLEAAPLFERGEAVVGSNNWAVAPQRTAAGHALLAGDPHLQLTLPSIWYEAHIVVRGGIDVYGVTIPLSPIVPMASTRT